MKAAEEKKGFSGMHVLGITAAAMVLTVLLTIFAAKYWLFPQPFTPVVLSAQEEQQLEAKLKRLDTLTDQPISAKKTGQPLPQDTASQSIPSPDTPPLTSGEKRERITTEILEPEAYSEEGASREVNFSEREINSLLAKNTDLANKMAIDFANDLISAKILLPVDPDFPMFGGKVLRVRAGAELAYRNSKPIVKLRGVSIMGVPVPNAWLGGLKNIDLVNEFGTEEGFWKTFADGVESINVREKELYIKLKE